MNVYVIFKCVVLALDRCLHLRTLCSNAVVNVNKYHPNAVYICCRYFVFEAFRDIKEIRLSDAMKAWSEIISENEAKKVYIYLSI